MLNQNPVPNLYRPRGRAKTHNQVCLQCGSTRVRRKARSGIATYFYCVSCARCFRVPNDSTVTYGGNAAWRALSAESEAKSEWLGTFEKLHRALDQMEREDYANARRVYYAKRKEKRNGNL